MYIDASLGYNLNMLPKGAQLPYQYISEQSLFLSFSREQKSRTLTVLKDPLFQAGASLRPFVVVSLVTIVKLLGLTIDETMQTSGFAMALQNRITFNDGSFW